jgi:nitrilase
MALVRAAVVQAGAVVFDVARTLAKLADLTADAARQGARLAVFPEAFVSGYPKGLDFGARVGQRSPEGREQFRRYFDSAMEVPGPATEQIGRAARAGKLHLVVGVIERDGGTLYCTALFFGPDGQLLGKHRKLMPTAMERLIWGFGDGSTLTVLDTPLGKLGAVICWENYMPLLRMAMYAKGVQLYCAPTADDRDTWLPTMRHVALEGRCFVLSACQYLTRGACPPDYAAAQDNDPATVLMRGGSCIVSPLGQVLAGPSFEGECILAAELDPAEVARGKYDFDVVGHYARPDVFRLQVNEQPAQPVVFRAGADQQATAAEEASRIPSSPP